MGDDQVGWRDEEVVDPLESCADGMMYFADTGLRNYLCTMKKKKHIVHTDDCSKMGDNKVYPTEPDLAGGNIIHLYKGLLTISLNSLHARGTYVQFSATD